MKKNIREIDSNELQDGISIEKEEYITEHKDVSKSKKITKTPISVCSEEDRERNIQAIFANKTKRKSKNIIGKCEYIIIENSEEERNKRIQAFIDETNHKRVTENKPQKKKKR